MDKLLSIEDLEVLKNTYRKDVRLNRALAQQLANTIRKNERLLKALKSYPEAYSGYLKTLCLEVEMRETLLNKDSGDATQNTRGK